MAGPGDVFAAEALRRDGRLAEAEALVERGLRVATEAEYWYAVGFAQRTAGYISAIKGCVEEATAKLADGSQTFSASARRSKPNGHIRPFPVF